MTADDRDLRIMFAGFFGIVPAGPDFGPRVRVVAEDLPRPILDRRIRRTTSGQAAMTSRLTREEDLLTPIVFQP